MHLPSKSEFQPPASGWPPCVPSVLEPKDAESRKLRLADGGFNVQPATTSN